MKKIIVGMLLVNCFGFSAFASSNSVLMTCSGNHQGAPVQAEIIGELPGGRVNVRIMFGYGQEEIIEGFAGIAISLPNPRGSTEPRAEAITDQNQIEYFNLPLPTEPGIGEILIRHQSDFGFDTTTVECAAN